jgi:hypothetical protein
MLTMNKSIFTLAVIASMAMLLIILNQLDFLTKYSIFAMIPIIAAYYLGQFAEKKFKK